MKKVSKLIYLIAMSIYGTVGIISHYINLPSGLIVLSRGIIGCIVISLYMLITKQKVDFTSIKRNLKWLILAGICLGGNWICLFGAFSYTSVSVATLCNYFGPALILALGPLLLHEKIDIKKIICLIVAVIGMVLVSGIIPGGISDKREIVGILMGLGAALFYAFIIIVNKKYVEIKPLDKTIVTLLVATIIMVPYAMLTANFSAISFDAISLILIFVLGIVNTGFAYVLYFGSMEYLDASTIAIYSYIEPVLSVILSWVVLKEEFSLMALFGGIMILGATFISEIHKEKN